MKYPCDLSMSLEFQQVWCTKKQLSSSSNIHNVPSLNRGFQFLSMRVCWEVDCDCMAFCQRLPSTFDYESINFISDQVSPFLSRLIFIRNDQTRKYRTSQIINKFIKYQYWRIHDNKTIILIFLLHHHIMGPGEFVSAHRVS